MENADSGPFVVHEKEFIGWILPVLFAFCNFFTREQIIFFSNHKDIAKTTESSNIARPMYEINWKDRKSSSTKLPIREYPISRIESKKNKLIQSQHKQIFSFLALEELSPRSPNTLFRV